MNARVAASQHMIELAGLQKTPLFITHEDSKTGTGAMPPALVSALPAHAKEFIKTTFAATGQPQFADALAKSGLRRFVVTGAETDVCVLQTMLGMRRAGYAVYALTDALFTEEVNDAPALARMKRSGITAVTAAQADALVKDSVSLPVAKGSGTSVRPLSMGFVLSGLSGLSMTDTNGPAKRARLRELLLVSEWFQIPVFASDPAAATNALPADLRSLVKTPTRPLASKPATIKELAVFGGHPGIAATSNDLRSKVESLFLVEDALVGGDRAALEPLYTAPSANPGGTIPTTYKTLYYELMTSVNDAEWPSPQWVTRSNPYYDLTMAPEELPQLR